MEYSPRVVDAFSCAYDLHRTQFRKGSRIPYITHLTGVASIVGRYGGDEDQFIAALLHDAVEDQGGRETLDAIRARFGATVAGYVEGCTDSCETPKPEWHERKTRFIEHTANAPQALKLIIAADKLHNARSILCDLREAGDLVWTIFKVGRDDVLWYYTEMARALSNEWSHAILRELDDTIDAIQREVVRRRQAR